MNDTIRKHVHDFLAKDGNPVSDEDIVEAILEAKEVWRDEGSYRRWWRDHFCVVDVNGMKIGFMTARTTGDDSPRDKGWEFDASTICLVEPVQQTVTTYKPVKEQL